MEAKKWRRSKSDFESVKYRMLLENIKKIVGEVLVKSTPVGERVDTLACHTCASGGEKLSEAHLKINPF
jgi:hypothetical protein